MSREVAVRRGSGPVHVAIPATGTLFLSACGKRFRGIGAVVPVRDWQRGRRCPECDEILDHAPTPKILRLIAGW